MMRRRPVGRGRGKTGPRTGQRENFGDGRQGMRTKEKKLLLSNQYFSEDVMLPQGYSEGVIDP
jgi:hypothetical protein